MAPALEGLPSICSLCSYTAVDYILKCTGFVWEGFSGDKESCRDGFCKKLFALCAIETAPAGSKTDLLLTKTKSIGNSANTPVIICLRERESCCTTEIAAGERNENERETALKTPRSVKEEEVL